MTKLPKPYKQPPPEKFYGWIYGPLSVAARHYGGIKLNGVDYVIDYGDPQQPLVRWDIFKAEAKAKIKAARDAEKKINAKRAERQGQMFGSEA